MSANEVMMMSDFLTVFTPLHLFLTDPSHKLHPAAHISKDRLLKSSTMDFIIVCRIPYWSDPPCLPPVQLTPRDLPGLVNATLRPNPSPYRPESPENPEPARHTSG